MTIETDLDVLFQPLEESDRWVVGQLGQSMDGRIATVSGHSHYINGPEDIRRLHRLRALADAVVVGAGTATGDDPRLTVRLVEGDHPIRVVLDPNGRLDPALRIFQDDTAETIRMVGVGMDVEATPAEHVTLVRLPTGECGFDPHEIVEVLRGHSLHRILIEGGGLTVSGFLEVGALDRLHLSVAPLLLGSGRPSITLPQIETLEGALRPKVHHFRVGDDLVFDVELEGGRP